MRAEQVTEVVSEHGEGPVWSAAEEVLLFVDMLKGDLLRLDAQGAVRRHHVDAVLSALRPRSRGGLVVGVERGFRLLAADLTPVGDVPVFADPAIRMNDGGCDPQGRFYCGTMAYDERPGAGSLYRLDPDGGVQAVLRDVTISNGIQWSADGRTVHYIDTPTRRVDAFDFDAGSGTFSGRRPFATMPDGGGDPDGMAPDEEGGLWVACWSGGAVRRFDADGRLDEVVELPVPNPTACAFGGPEGRTLYITTSTQGAGSRTPESGAVFAVETGVRGAALPAFAG